MTIKTLAVLVETEDGNTHQVLLKKEDTKAILYYLRHSIFKSSNIKVLAKKLEGIKLSFPNK